MKIIVFGASGRVGQLVVIKALTEGYNVVAFTHSNNPFKKHANLTVIRGNVKDFSDVKKAITNCDAVVSTLGSWNTADKDIVSSGMHQIVEAAQQLGVKRVISLTGSGAYWSGDKLRPVDTLSHLLLKTIAPKILKDGEAHIEILEASNLDWTIVRSPAMKDGRESSYKFNTSIGSPLARVSRKTVATALVEQLQDGSFVRQAPVIHSAK